MDGLTNYNTLRDRLKSNGNQAALSELEEIQAKAQNEFRAFMESGAKITIEDEEFTNEKRNAMSNEEKDRALFTLGSGCLEGKVDTNMVNGNLVSVVPMRLLNFFAHCAMLHVLVMLEDMEGLQEKAGFKKRKFSFVSSDHKESIDFNSFIEKIPSFYPWATTDRSSASEDESKIEITQEGIDRFNSLRDLLSNENNEIRNAAYGFLLKFLQETACIILTPLDDDKPVIVYGPNQEPRLAVFMSRDQIPSEYNGITTERILPFKFACYMVQGEKNVHVISIDPFGDNSMTITADAIKIILESTIEIKPKQEKSIDAQNKESE